MEWWTLAGVIAVPILMVLLAVISFFLQMARREIDEVKREIVVLHGRIDRKDELIGNVDLKLDDVIGRLIRLETLIEKGKE